MTTRLPLAMLPDDWAEKGRCLICGAAPLHIRPGLEVADQLACTRCGTAFEVEDGGPHIRLTHLPAEAKAAPDGAWRTGPEARAWVRGLVAEAAQRKHEAARSVAPHPNPPHSASLRETRLPAGERENLDDAKPLPSPTGRGVGDEVETEPSSSPPSEPPPPQPPISDSSVPPEALSKAQDLLALRHTSPQIRAILQREWTPEQVQAVMAEVERLEAQNRARQMRIGWMTVTGAALVLLVVGGLALNAVLGSRGLGLPGGASQADDSGAPGPGGAVVQPTQTNSPFIDPKNLPAPLQTLIPPGVQILNPPTPSVKQGDGPPAKACPISEDEAARVFGGQASDWHRDAESNGWTMITVGAAATISVPANMTAGYMTFGDSLKITQVNGPATIENVYMIALSCE